MYLVAPDDESDEEPLAITDSLREIPALTDGGPAANDEASIRRPRSGRSGDARDLRLGSRRRRRGRVAHFEAKCLRQLRHFLLHGEQAREGVGGAAGAFEDEAADDDPGDRVDRALTVLPARDGLPRHVEEGGQLEAAEAEGFAHESQRLARDGTSDGQDAGDLDVDALEDLGGEEDEPAAAARQSRCPNEKPGP
jgi:hypothetical protein